MRRLTLVAAVAAFVSFQPAAATLPELFQKAKEQFKLGNYKQALATVEALDAESGKPGNEAERQKMLPALLFYKGASLAALGRTEEGVEALGRFLELQPNARLDPSLYPPKVVAAMDAARRKSAAAEASAQAPAETGVLATAYRAFQPPQTKPAEELGEDWASGPARYLLTPSEVQDFRSLTDGLARSEYIANFWKRHDPKPETPENEFRDEFEKRVAFADARFTQDELRGSLTDRGMIFILFGPPTYNGRRPLNAADEAGAADTAGQSRFSRSEVAMAQHASGSNTNRVAAMDHVTGEGTSINRAASNWTESWTYLRSELPKSVPYQELKVQFVTKEGYGRNVLQREPIVVTAIEQVKKASRSDEGKTGS